MQDTTEGGQALIDYSKEEFSAQRSVIGDWFPYMYIASRRMSLRAISRWLKEEQRIKLSFVAIARAMQNAERHWQELAESIEPAARVFGEAHKATLVDVLTRPELFEALELKPPRLTRGADGTIEAAMDEYMEAASVLRNRWFAYPQEVRDECRRHIACLSHDEPTAIGPAKSKRRKTK